MSDNKIMVTGSRDWRDISIIRFALCALDPKATLLQGCATGADAIARSIWVSYGSPVKDFWPDYAQYEFAEANKRRNAEMVDEGPLLVFAFPTPSSRGTYHAVNLAVKARIPVRIYNLKGEYEMAKEMP